MRKVAVEKYVNRTYFEQEGLYPSIMETVPASERPCWSRVRVASQNWVAFLEFTLSYHNSDTILLLLYIHIMVTEIKLLNSNPENGPWVQGLRFPRSTAGASMQLPKRSYRRGSKYPFFQVFGPKKHTLNGFLGCCSGTYIRLS